MTHERRELGEGRSALRPSPTGPELPSRPERPPGPGELGPAAIRLYTRLLEHGPATTAALAAALGLDEEEAGRAVVELVRHRLAVHDSGGRPRRCAPSVPTPPRPNWWARRRARCGTA
ncbi:hypothetical protein [Streptomyces sudanensis]|uniref:hypothetical protein n=1 Tax=Streptomyces sudanensis TaxID=436397 RepID=UPI0020CDA42B|nr:hypothetical protein [Streptomyces sudanensis]MCQ0002746.1 hypothetical protein [Streptomyces sudanensis]